MLLKNGLVYTMTMPAPEVMDVLVEGSLIKAVGKNLDAEGHTVIDCSGKLVMPGFVDAHCHLGHFRRAAGIASQAAP